jgi:hypothetical protein
MKVYFFCYPHGPANKSGYEHQIISIAEGLKLLNIDFSGNVNYWRNSVNEDDFLIKEEKDIDLDSVDAVVFSSALFYYKRLDLLNNDMFHSKRKYKLIFLDTSDGLITPGFNKQIRNVDFVLKSHFCKKHFYPKNFVPWQFGLTNRIINSVDPLPFEQRKDEVQVNFRVKHQLRKLIDKNVMESILEYYKPNNTIDIQQVTNFNGLDELFWHQTGRRHYPSYYLRLGQSKLSSAFGGYLQKSNFANNKRIFSDYAIWMDNTFNPKLFDRIYQFDSWRFWESLASGCCTLHLDFEKYGVNLPVMPKNKTHYLGIDLENISAMKDVLKSKELVAEIGENGREWVLSNYSPKNIAERFLQLII